MKRTSLPLRRREFITLLGGTVAWPRAARAQQGERMHRIGVLMPPQKVPPQLCRAAPTLRGLRPLARVEATCTGIRDIPWLGR